MSIDAQPSASSPSASAVSSPSASATLSPLAAALSPLASTSALSPFPSEKIYLDDLEISRILMTMPSPAALDDKQENVASFAMPSVPSTSLPSTSTHDRPLNLCTGGKGKVIKKKVKTKSTPKKATPLKQRFPLPFFTEMRSDLVRLSSVLSFQMIIDLIALNHQAMFWHGHKKLCDYVGALPEDSFKSAALEFNLLFNSACFYLRDMFSFRTTEENISAAISDIVLEIYGINVDEKQVPNRIRSLSQNDLTNFRLYPCFDISRPIRPLEKKFQKL